MNKTNIKTQSAFTLLEVIIVIIIIGVLTSLALPRLFEMIQKSYAAEAYSAISSLRVALDRCYLINNGSYDGCYISNLGISNPADSPNSHFNYYVSDLSETDGKQAYIAAWRNCRDGGSPGFSGSISSGLREENLIIYSTLSDGSYCGGGIFGKGSGEACLWLEDWDINFLATIAHNWEMCE